MPFRLSIALLTACVAAAAIAQPAPQTTSVPTVTRLVKMFSDLERRLVEKTHAKDASALDATVWSVPDASSERMAHAVAPMVSRDGQQLAVLLTFTDTTRTFILQQEQ